MSLGERIAEMRTLCGMSQNQLAKTMNVSRQAVSKWETDQSMPDSLKMIHLAEVLESDVEYLTTGRKNYGRRPPVVINTVETVEKVVEKPVVEYVEKPVIKKIYRKQVVRNPLEFAVCGGICFLLGLLVGIMI